MLEYRMDISPASVTCIASGGAAARAFPFYVMEAGYFDAGEGYFTRRDGQDDALILLTHTGKGEMNWLGQTVALEPGSALIITCEQFHEYRTRPGGRWAFSWAHIAGDGLRGYRQALFAHLMPVAMRAPDAARAILADMRALLSRQDMLAMAELSDCGSRFLTEMMRSLAVGGDSAPLGREDVRKLAEYIRRNCARPLTMADFEREISLSRYHLIRVFARQMGMPPYKYLHACRVSEAQRLLRATDQSVSEIAYAVGYTDPVNFIRHFRQVAGTTPARYRAESTQLYGERT